LSPRRQVQQILEALCPGRVKIREPLAPLTTWKIGGKADWLVAPKDAIEVQQLLAVGRDYRLPCYFLGAGSNILVGDQGVRGIVIHLTPFLNWIKPRTRSGRVLSLEIGAGTLLSAVIRCGVKESLTGLEFLVGIPGSLGGAWALNAGSQGREIKDLTRSLNIIDSRGQIMKRSRKALDFSYRRLALNPGEVIVSGLLKVVPGNREEIVRKMRALVKKRRAAQPWRYPSCGSVFKNPPGDYAGRLIEAAALKGRRQGEAQVSWRHANFIVNRGQAQARDVLRLMRVIRQRVQRQSGVLLEPEVRFWGCSLDPRSRVPKAFQK
jgi:UDP-N-acetylmuramate dehydrogenase